MTISLRRFTIASLAALAALAVSATAVHASIGVIGEFGETGPGALETGGGWEGIGVNPVTGDVYVADGGHYRVVEFSPTGEFILTFGEDVNGTKVSKGGASEAEENVCTAASGDECQAGIEGTAPGQFATVDGVAVSAAGDVYVADGLIFGGSVHRVEKFSSTGSYVSQIESGAKGAPSFSAWSIAVDLEDDLYMNDIGAIIKFDPAGVFTGLAFGVKKFPRSVAVDPSGFIYVSEYQGPVAKVNPAGEEVGTLDQEGGEAEGGLAVNLANGEVFSVVFGLNEILQYSSSGSLTGRIPNAGGNAIAYDTGVGKLYERVGNRIVVYGLFPLPSAGAPAVGRESHSNLGQTTAVIHANVDPHSLDTTYEVQYGTSPTLAGAASAPASPADGGSGFLSLPVSVGLSGLQPSALYYYRVVAHNMFGGGAGSVSEGSIQSFITLPPPPVVTVGEPLVGSRSATLNAVIAPGSVGLASDTRWCLQYGRGTAYELGFLPQVAQDDLGQGTSGMPVSVQLSNLTPSTTYHYRLVAVNGLVGENLGSESCEIVGGQEVAGADHTFTTGPPAAPVVETGAASGVSQNAASVSGSVDPSGTQTFYEFDLGTDTTYGSRVFGEVGSQQGPQSLTVSFGGLAPGTVYHYRLVASGPGGTTYGADRTFTTLVFPTATLSAPIVEPLVATPTVAFPTETKETATVKRTAPKAHRKKPKHKRRKRAKRHRRARRHKRAKKAGGAAVDGHAGVTGRGKR